MVVKNPLFALFAQFISDQLQQVPSRKLALLLVHADFYEFLVEIFVVLFFVEKLFILALRVDVGDSVILLEKSQVDQVCHVVLYGLNAVLQVKLSKGARALQRDNHRI